MMFFETGTFKTLLTVFVVLSIVISILIFELRRMKYIDGVEAAFFGSFLLNVILIVTAVALLQAATFPA